MPKFTRSDLWNYFVKVKGGECKICHSLVKSLGTTTNMKKHMERKHPKVELKNADKKAQKTVEPKTKNLSQDLTVLTPKMGPNANESNKINESISSTPSTSFSIRQPLIHAALSNVESFQVWKMWVIVLFLKENSVECIPSCWLTDSNKCYWPPYRGSKLKSTISLCEKPQEDWETFHIRILNGEKVYDQLVQARSACDRAQYNSDLSDINDETKRKQKKKIVSSSSEDEDENEIHIHGSKIPLPPRISGKPREYSEHVVKIPEPKGKKHVEKNVGAPSTSSFFSESGVNPISEAEDTSSQKNLNPTTETSVDYKSLQEFQHVIRKLNIINLKVDQMGADITQIHNLLRNEKEVRVDNSSIDFTLPLNSEEELNNLEEELKNKEKYAKFFAYVEKIGGCSEYDNIKRIFGRIFANELATQYNWLGLKKKKPLHNLLVTKIAKDAILKNPRIPNGTEKSIEFAMKNWLRHAKDRANKGADNQVVANQDVAENREAAQEVAHSVAKK